MLKGIRNNMLKKNIVCKINVKEVVGKWDHIVTLYEENPAFIGLKFLPKLTEHHVIPGKIKKMKVLCATQVFSASVAMCMGYFAGFKTNPYVTIMNRVDRTKEVGAKEMCKQVF